MPLRHQPASLIDSFAAAAASQLAKTACKHGHPLTGSNLVIRTEGNRVRRRCAVCLRIKNTVGTQLGADTVAKLKAGLAAGLPISHLVCTRTSKSRVTTNWAGLRRLRMEDPAFDALVRRAITSHTPDHSSRRRPLKGAIAAQPSEIYTAIDKVLPRSLPDQIRQEAMSDMMLAVLEQQTTLAEACTNRRQYVAQAYRMFPIDNPKFGGAKLVSLDEIIFDGSRNTRGDLVSVGLWT